MARTALTVPSDRVNDHDNANGDLVVYVDDVIEAPDGISYTVVRSLGAGQYGQVFHVRDPTSDEFAVKISRAGSLFLAQFEREVQLLALVQDHDTDDAHTSKLIDTFVFHGHACIVLELLSLNIFTVLQRRKFVGLPLSVVQSAARDLVESLVLFETAQVVHGDIKPENIVLANDRSAHIKLIDFGIARRTEEPWHDYIQSRYYRAPEVVLRLPHGFAVDTWSVGCVLIEIFIGVPAFAGQNEVQLFEIVTGFLGPIPSEIARTSPRFDELFFPDGQPKTEVEYCAEKGIPTAHRHHYLWNESNLEELIMTYKSGITRTREERKIARDRRRLFADLVMRMLHYVPEERIRPREALVHPFFAIDFTH
jgi:dual specificity protein kinase YAK1